MSKTGLYSSVDVSILHKDRRGQYSLSSIFLNPKLMAVSLMHTIASFRKLIFSLRSMSFLFMVSVLRRVSSGTDHFSHGFANPRGYPGMGGTGMGTGRLKVTHRKPTSHVSHITLLPYDDAHLTSLRSDDVVSMRVSRRVR